MLEEKDIQQNNKAYDLSQNDFIIRRTAGKFLINSIISMVFIYIGSLIDTLLVGMYLSEDGLAAMSLVSPVYLVFYTVGATIGIGGSILASRAVGQGNVLEYQRIFTASTILMGIAAAFMILVGYVFINPIMHLLCGNVTGPQYDMAKSYLMCYIPGGSLTLMSYIPLYFLKTEGKPEISSRLFTMSAIINVILSWLFMSPVFNMGTAGASLATTISYGCVAILGFIIMLKGKGNLKFEKESLEKSRIKDMLTAGIPNGISNLLESARIYMVNMLLIYSGAAVMLTCYTVVRNVNDLCNSIIIGISSALIPLIGVFFGERDYFSERAVMKRSMKFGIVIMAIVTVIVAVIPGPLFRLFGVEDPAMIAEGRWALPLSSLGLIAAYANTLYTSYLTAIKKEGIASILVAFRLFLLLAVFAVPLAFTVGSKGIWLSLSLAEFATFIVFCIIRNVQRKKKPSLDKYLLDTNLESQEDISFAVANDVNEIVGASEKISAFCEDHDIDMKTSMRLSLAIEEILTFLLKYCLGENPDEYVSIRVFKMEAEVMIRFRYVGKIYDPMDFYKTNSDNEEMEEELLGLKMMTKSAKLINFQQTLGLNNLMMIF